MDTKLLSQVQNYTPPSILQQAFKNPQACYQLARLILDREFKSRPQKWKSQAFPEYDDFFQAALSGFNPYKDTSGAKDKGLLQAIQTYNPYKKLQEKNQLILKTIDGIEQALCPHCNQRGEETSLWSKLAGNTSDIEAPDPVFYKGYKYCGKKVSNEHPDLSRLLSEGSIHKIDNQYYCSFKNRLTSLRSYISSQVNFLIQDIRAAEYHSSRTIRRYPSFPCKSCGTLNTDWNHYSNEKKEILDCKHCGHKIDTKEYQGKRGSDIVWTARGGGSISIDQIANEDEDGRSVFESIISKNPTGKYSSDPAVLHNTLDIERGILMERLIKRIKELSLDNLPEKQRIKFIKDNFEAYEDGVPETQNFKIFYNYFFMDDADLKKEHNGRSKNKADESSNYRQLALKYLKKEQHYSRCLDCGTKVYEPTESGKFKRNGPNKQCLECDSFNMKYHGPKCGRIGSLDPCCKEHGDTEIVMYIFQTIEPKIRRLEELVRADKEACDLYRRIRELILAREEADYFVDMIKLLNY